MEESTWDKHKLPCPKCGGSDPVSTNTDGSGYCFSCNHYFKNYQQEVDGNIVDMASHKEPSTFLNSYTLCNAELSTYSRLTKCFCLITSSLLVSIEHESNNALLGT